MGLGAEKTHADGDGKHNRRRGKVGDGGVVGGREFAARVGGFVVRGVVLYGICVGGYVQMAEGEGECARDGERSTAEGGAVHAL